LGAAELAAAIEEDIKILELPAELLHAEMERKERAREEIRAALDPPKTLAELQTPPTENVLGYDQHHNVNQNPANLAKSPVEILLEKFGQNRINAPGNLFWIPRLKHRLISDYYSEKEPFDRRGRTRRAFISVFDFDTQYKIGLQIMRKFGVLK
jgi:hypothetical protein